MTVIFWGTDQADKAEATEAEERMHFSQMMSIPQGGGSTWLAC